VQYAHIGITFTPRVHIFKHACHPIFTEDNELLTFSFNIK
jgi:hypothetical protein